MPMLLKNRIALTASYRYDLHLQSQHPITRSSPVCSFVDRLGQLIATHRCIPYKEGGKPRGISDYNQYTIQNKLVKLSRE